MKVLNLYAGLGGNSMLWGNCTVTHVENNKKIANILEKNTTRNDDKIYIGDAHEYLKQHFRNYDYVWSSPPCPTHSRMAKATRHEKREYPDMRLYQEILFLQHFYDGLWCVENVIPYYEFLIPPTAIIGRHAFWTNYPIIAEDIYRPRDFINTATIDGMRKLQDWLGIYYEDPVYFEGSHDPCKALRNCVHPELGLQVFQSAFGPYAARGIERRQAGLFDDINDGVKR